MCASTAERRRVVVCADASAEIGLGHVVRSIALAEELASAGWAVVVCGSGIPAGYAGDSVEIIETSPVPDPAPVLALRPDLVVVDGYHFTPAFFAEFERAGVRYAVIDDNAETPARRPAAVINQNPHADAAMYAHLEGDPRLLLGIEFTLLRREVVEAARRPDPPSRSSAVLVAFGGSDPRRLTAPVAAALAGAGIDVRVAIGAAHPDRLTVVSELDARRIAVIAPADYVTELATAGVAVLAAGTSVWEAACLGTPTVAVEVAPNQHGPVQAAHERGLVRASLIADDRLLTALPPVVASILESPEQDGSVTRPSAAGTQRVAQTLGELVPEPLRLRAATMSDAAFLFDLRTDPDVDRQSDAAAPTWEAHRAWLAATIDDPGRRLLIVEAGERSIGQLRLDDVGDDHVISVALVEPARSGGIGHRAIGLAQTMAAGDLVARIKAGNTASRAVFARAGFRCESGGDESIVMRWRREPGPPEVSA